MKSNVLRWNITIIALFSVFAGAHYVHAEIPIWKDTLSVSGFLRYELGLHTAGSNPNNPGQDNFDLTLARAFFQTEWTFKPSEQFKVFSKVRLMADQTAQWDSELDEYDAFPIDVPEDDWTMLKADNDDWRAEVWELYSDVTLGNLWLRLGKQQIVWGEMIATRLMDVINPLDFSWNFLFEPEEFENIRIPQWMLRGIYTVGQDLPLFNDVTIEGFINPGDVLPNQYADAGAPFNVMGPFPPFFNIDERDRRGRAEYGARVGAMIGSVYLTVNYLHVYSDDFVLNLQNIAFRPFAVNLTQEYPELDIYGLTFNYFFGGRINTVVTFEGTWVPDQPYQTGNPDSPMPPLPEITDQGTFSYAVRLDRVTFVLPRPTSALNITVQLTETIREGDEDDILGPNNSRIDKTDEMLTLQLRQPLWHNNIEVSFLTVYDLDEAHYIKPSFKYVYGDHWYFDLFAVFLGGEEDRPQRFGSLGFGDEVVFRATYQF